MQRGYKDSSMDSSLKIRRSLYNQLGINESEYKKCGNWSPMKNGCGTVGMKRAMTNDTGGIFDNQENGPRDAHDLPYNTMLMVIEDFTEVGLHIAKVESHVGHDDVGII